MAERRILHLDMDAFYAAVELLRRPDLKGRPLVIGGRGEPGVERRDRYAGRGVVTTASYEARAYGIHSAMPLRVAYRLCPHAVFLPTDFEEYRRVSAIFKACMREVSPVMEDRGIDEAYLDISALRGESEDIGRALKERIFESTRLTCSVGIAPNKLLAKMASELQKPDGLTILHDADVPRRIWPLEVRKLPGVGPVTEQTLLEMGIRTVGELAAQPPIRLMSAFGSLHGRGLHRAAQGSDERPVEIEREPRSRSRETTFERDVEDGRLLAGTLAELVRELSEELREEGYSGRTVGVKLRFSDFRTVTRDVTLAAPVDREEDIKSAALGCLSRIDIDRRIRLVGVRVGNLQKALGRTD